MNTNHTDSVETTDKEILRKKLINVFYNGFNSYHDIDAQFENVYDFFVTTLQATQSQQVEEAVERVAKAIYDEMVCDDPRGKPDWVPGGNSIKQDEARRKALQALTLNHQD